MRTSTLLTTVLAIIALKLVAGSLPESKEIGSSNPRIIRRGERKLEQKFVGRTNKNGKFKRKSHQKRKGRKIQRKNQGKGKKWQGKKGQSKIRAGKNMPGKNRHGKNEKAKKLQSKNGRGKNGRGKKGEMGGKIAKAKKRQNSVRAALKGGDCQYVDLAKIASVPGCDTGQKFVITISPGIRKQYLIVDGKAILAFFTGAGSSGPTGRKFWNCSSTMDITSSVDCSGKKKFEPSSFSLSSNSSDSGSGSGGGGGESGSDKCPKKNIMTECDVDCSNADVTNCIGGTGSSLSVNNNDGNFMTTWTVEVAEAGASCVLTCNGFNSSVKTECSKSADGKLEWSVPDEITNKCGGSS